MLECERAYRLMPLYGASLVAVHMGLGGPTGGRTGGVPFLGISDYGDPLGILVNVNGRFIWQNNTGYGTEAR